MNLKMRIRPWKLEAVEKQLFSEHARYGSVVIETSEDAARAVLVDDHGGIRAAFKVELGQLHEIIAAATRSWIASNRGGSLGIFIRGLKERGEITPPIPPPPPGPGGHERIFLKQTIAAHLVFDAAAELAQLEELGQLEQKL